jgi:carboxypeptidase Taq
MSLERVLRELRKVAYLESASALLSWDQEVYMPPGAGHARAEQIAFISGLAHDIITGKEMKKALAGLVDLETGKVLDKSAQKKTRRLLTEIWNDYHRAVALPSEFVKELSKQASMTQQVWVIARQENDYKSYEPHLAKMIELKKQQAQYIDPTQNPYNVLMDEYEPGMTMKKLDPLFKEMSERLVPLIKSIAEVKHRVNNSVLKKQYPIDKQWDFGMDMLKTIGFDFNKGRQDKSAHPFTTGTHPSDIRLTTRFIENDLRSALLSTLHEGGHGLYEQGLPEDQFGNPFGQAISLGIHESQSRLWENLVGLDEKFWTYAFPKLKSYFPENLKDGTKDEFVRAVNKVQPSFIRVEADEATYNLHIMIRYEIEKALINDNFPTSELPKLWNDKYEEYLGIRPENDAEGVLQDVHWSFGALGYFPTYSLGNLYSVQFFNTARQEIDRFDEKMERGDLLDLRNWLKEKIHKIGREKTADELVLSVTGEALNASYYLDYIETKYQNMYGIK